MRDTPVRLVFYGNGKRRGEIADFMRAHPECRVELHDYAPAEQLAAHLQSAEVHVASLDPAWTGTMVPSKLQGIFAAGRAVVFLGSADSSIGQWVAESGGGWVLQPDDGPGLVAALAEASDPQLRADRGRAAGVFAAAHFSQTANIPRVAAILSRDP
jgi:glycosyltransferase involved in cell wall biosynthesis